MPLNIKNDEVERLAAEVARLTGESKPKPFAVRSTRGRRRLRSVSPRARRTRVLRFLEDKVWAGLPSKERGRRLSREKRGTPSSATDRKGYDARLVRIARHSLRGSRATGPNRRGPVDRLPRREWRGMRKRRASYPFRSVAEDDVPLSSRDSRRPRSFDGKPAHTLSSRKRSTRVRRARGETLLSRRRRFVKRTANGLGFDSPVSRAPSPARRSTSSFLMFSGTLTPWYTT